MLTNLFSGFFATPSAFDTEDLYTLLIDVLPAFDYLAQHIIECQNPAAVALRAELETTDPRFYVQVHSQFYTLEKALNSCDPSETAICHLVGVHTINESLVRLLEELESRFWKRKDRRVQFACDKIGFQINPNETFPQLRDLREALPDDIEQDKGFVSGLRDIIHLASTREAKRQQLLQRLQEAYVLFSDLHPGTVHDGLSCPFSLESYPSKHVRKCANLMFKMIQQNWCCECRANKSHTDRTTHLSLTEYRHFNMAPVGGLSQLNRRAEFRILLPSGSHDCGWQDTFVGVKEQGRQKSEWVEVTRNLCNVIQAVAKGTRLRLTILGNRLGQIRADLDRPFFRQVQSGQFVTLDDLLRWRGATRDPVFKSVEGKHRLILLFILATSFLHFYEGPWLHQNLNRLNICFLTPRPSTTPDVTKPYLAANCSHSTSPPKLAGLNQAHRYPSIQSLGVLFLEIVRSSCFEIKDGEDVCFSTLEACDEWVDKSRKSRSTTIPDGLMQALYACLDPKNLAKKGLDQDSVTENDVRRYIFEEIVYPLGEALSIAHQIDLGKLHDACLQEEEEMDAFDHYDEEDSNKRENTDKWFKRLNAVNNSVYNLIDKFENRSKEERSAVRVKVAIVDSGIHLPDALAANYEKAGRISVTESMSFLDDSKSPQEWRTDADGHGTRVSQILLKVAPTVDIHIARVFERRQELKNPRVAARVHQQITNAIIHATTKWEVDVIVMSLGFDKEIPCIRQAIDNTLQSKKRPLFFAATRNDGANQGVAWPARYGEVIGISSTDGDGYPSTFNPPSDLPHQLYYALGEAIPVEHVDLKQPTKRIKRYVSGTSYAAPVAAGLAGNLLGCVRMAVQLTKAEEYEKYKDVPEKLQKKDAMRTALKYCMSKTHDCGVESVLPWDFLSAANMLDNQFLKTIRDTI